MSCAVTRAQGGSPIETFPYIVLSFFSGVFYPAELEPHWLQDLARAFPLAPFAESLERCFDPRTAAPGFSGLDVVILLAWTAVGLAVALRWFRFEPRSPSRSGARQDRRRAGWLAPDGR
jgi:ABC-2 type transport system permease protein